MKMFDLLKGFTDTEKFSEFIFDVLKEKESPEEIKMWLEKEVPEDPAGGLQTLQSIAQSDYPWSFDGIQ